MSSAAALPEVFSAREIARVAGVSPADVRALIASREVIATDGHFLTAHQAVRAVRTLRAARLNPARTGVLFQPAAEIRRPARVPFVASGALHAALLGIFILLTMLGVTKAQVNTPAEFKSMRLVFLATPGTGGGGGGGGLRQPVQPPRVRQIGTNPLRSPVPVERAVKVARAEPVVHETPTPPPPPTPVVRPPEPPPPVAKPDPIPPVVAPVVSAPADSQDRAGVLTDTSSETDSHGPGSGGGTGSGQGTGVGEGNGAGIGPGSGGGIGGGPYRPGSGITPPGLLREVKPDYTEEARRRGISGDVVLEIVVRSDGSVGPVRLLQGLGAGLDQRAVEAVRQWRFSPGRRFGNPVDVMVEVAVEFRLR
jgi:protein TonB